MSADSFYWIFSTNAQVFGGLIALLGVFIVFNLGVIEQGVQAPTQKLYRIVEQLGRPLDGYQGLELVDAAQGIIKDFEKTAKTSMTAEADRLLSVIEFGIIQKKFIRQQFSPLLIYLTFILACSLIFMHGSFIEPYLHWSITAYLLLGGSLFGLGWAVKFIMASLRGFK